MSEDVKATSASGVTRELATWAANLQYADLPPDVADMAKGLVLDFLRAVAIGVRTPWGNAVRGLALDLGSKGPSTILLFGDRIDPARAALVNGSFAHAADSDDTHVGSMLHPGAVVMPAAFAVAEHQGSNGSDVLAAIVAGYEAAIRLSLSVQPSHFKQGFQATGTCGTFGAAVAAGRLLGLSPSAMAGALGIAGSSAGGLAQFYYSGSWVKRIHAGKAAESGVMAALFARAGVEGPRDVIEGEAGFARAYAQSFDPTQITTGLGLTYKLPEITIKPHATSARLQAAVQATFALAGEQPIDPAAVEHIEIAIPRVILGRLTKSDPPDCSAAQMSLPFTVGLALVLAHQRGADRPLSVEDYRARLEDPQVRRLAAATVCRVDAAIDAATTDELVPARVVLRLADGTERAGSVDRPLGSPGEPLNARQRAVLFRSSVEDLVSTEAADKTASEVEHLEMSPSILGVTRGFIQ